MSQVIEIKNGSFIRRILSFVIDYVILIPLVLILYQLWKEKLFHGQSLGNKITKIQLVDFNTGKKPSLFKILFRNTVFIITLGLSSVFVVLNDGRRGLGDVFASTMVINAVSTNN